jgi:toxin HigB-1
MIRDFASTRTEEFFVTGTCPAPWRGFEKVAERKLDMLNAATSLNDLRSPPGNRLEKLKGDRAKQWSIRINDQFRVCFVWGGDGPEQVEIVDYHD